MKTQLIKDNKTPEADNQRNETRADPEGRDQEFGPNWKQHFPRNELGSNTSAPAQAQHSPLPWHRDLARRGMIRDEQDSIVAEGLHTYDAAFIVRACNNAQRLADALQRAITGLDATEQSLLSADVGEALAEWEQAEMKNKDLGLQDANTREQSNETGDDIRQIVDVPTSAASNFPNRDCYVVQAWSNVDGWQDTKESANTPTTALDRATMLLNRDSSWMGNKRLVRVVPAVSLK